MRRAALAAIAGLLAVTGLAAEDPRTTTVRRMLMGTSMMVEAIGGTPAARAAVIDEAFAAMAEVDRLMSTYRPDSELARVNAEAAGRPVRVSAPLWSVLDAAARMSRSSHGAFDVTIGPLVRLWGVHDRRPHVPTAAELARVRPLVDYRHVILDPDGQTVRFRRPGVELDLGSLAKGFAVELAGHVLERKGFSGVADAGGHQYLAGRPTRHPAWQVGIADPDVPTRLIGTVSVDGGAVSTAGGRLLDPRTLAPSSTTSSVTVLSPDGTLADALSTTIALLGPVDGLRLVEAFPGAMAVIASRGTDGQVEIAMSAALRNRFRAVPTARR